MAKKNIKREEGSNNFKRQEVLFCGATFSAPKNFAKGPKIN